jgi:hypothetical protein
VSSLGRKDHDRPERRLATKKTGEAGAWLVLRLESTQGVSIEQRRSGESCDHGSLQSSHAPASPDLLVAYGYL